MNNNLKSSKIRKSSTRDEFYTTEKTAIQFVSPLGDAGFYDGKRIFCNCDGPESEIYKLLKKNFKKWNLASLEACQYNKDGFGKHTIYSKEKDEDIVEILPDNGSYDSPSSLEILGRSDLVVTNPPFSKQDQFISMLMELDKKFAIICNLINFKNNITTKFLLDRKFKLACAFSGGTFIHADGHEARVNVISVTNLDKVEDYIVFNYRIPKMTKQQLLEKGVLYHPDGLPDNHFEVKFLKDIPTDLREDEIVWCPMTVLINPCFSKRYEVDKDLFEKQKGGIKVGGKSRFYRIPMKLKASRQDLEHFDK